MDTDSDRRTHGDMFTDKDTDTHTPMDKEMDMYETQTCIC